MSQAARNSATIAAHTAQLTKHVKNLAIKSGLTGDESKLNYAESLDRAARTAELIPLHKIAFKVEVPASKDIGIPGELLWLDLGDLRIDPRYQRPITDTGRKTINAIVAGFNWSKFSPLVVARRPGGLFAIIDGQHRATGALTHGGIPKVPCLVIEGGDEIEAAAFAIINGQVTNVTATQIHIARVMAKEPDALRLEDICARAQVRIMRNIPPTWKPGQTVAIATLRSCLKRHGADTLVTALQCITQTGEGNPGYVKAPIIMGLCHTLAGNTLWRDAGETLFEAIETIGIPAIYRTAGKLKAEVGGAEWHQVQNVTRELLLRTMPAQRLPALPKPKAKG